MKILHQIFIVALVSLFGLLIACSGNKKSEEESTILLPVLIGEKYGFINEKGKIVIEPQFDMVEVNRLNDYSGGVCWARVGARNGLIDVQGNFVVEFPDSIMQVIRIKNGLYLAECVKNDSLHYNWVNKSGQYVFDSPVKETPEDNSLAAIANFSEGNYIFYAKTDKDGYYRYIADTDGRIIGRYDQINGGGFSQGLCAVKKDGKWGYVDTLGHMVINPIYDSASNFSDGATAITKKDSVVFFIDKTGKKLFEADSIETNIRCNRAFIILNGERFLVDKFGRKINKIKADSIVDGFSCEDSLAIIKRDGMSIVIDTLGKEVLSTDYEFSSHFNHGVAAVYKNGKVGFINKNGTELVIVNLKGERTNNDAGGYQLPSYPDILCVAANGATEYYDIHGNYIGGDMPLEKISVPFKGNKKDFEKYFDSKLSDLDPIEGIYYVTDKAYYSSRNDMNNMGLNNSSSHFYAVVRDYNTDSYVALVIDNPGLYWVNKFVKIGDTNTYAITKWLQENNYFSEGMVTLDDPNNFSFRLEQGHNNYYNFFVTYDFVKDYPPQSEYEKIQQVDWTGSGFAIADGYIATNYHVTTGAKNIRIKGVDGDMDKTYKAVVVASDSDHDISILRVVDKDFDSFGSIPYAIGKAMVDVGDEVYVLGYPKVSSMGLEVKLTEGVISSSSGYKGAGSMYQISAAVQPGNSGGPLFNDEGVAIGIVCGKHSDTDNAGYAVKISYLHSLINSSNLKINLSENHIKDKKLSKQVKKIKPYVYLIECSSK